MSGVLPYFHPYLPPFYYHPQLTRSRAVEEYFRFIHHHTHGRYSAPTNRGATKSTIERYTLAHKYKRMKKCVDDNEDGDAGTGDAEDDIEKCTICLCEFETKEDVRYVFDSSCFLDQ